MIDIQLTNSCLHDQCDYLYRMFHPVMSKDVSEEDSMTNYEEVD